MVGTSTHSRGFSSPPAAYSKESIAVCGEKAAGGRMGAVSRFSEGAIDALLTQSRNRMTPPRLATPPTLLGGRIRIS